jgi:hypothetical protein
VDIVIDTTSIYTFLNLPTDQMLTRVLLLFGWIPVAIVFLWGAKEMWMSYIRGQWFSTQKFILLAIDIPRGNQQTPKAVENIFTYLAGAHGTHNLIETYWEGHFQLSFSLEIVSIDGYTQFLIRTPDKFRNLVESAIYSQYADAEITEVDDYTEGYPTRFPDDEYDIWGAEFILATPSAFPIKTYDEFVYQVGLPEEQFKDPMAAYMDLCSSLHHGEQLWFQIILIPEAYDILVAPSEKAVAKILGEKPVSKQNIADKGVDAILGWISYFSEMLFSIWGDISESKTDDADDSFRMMNLKPKEKKQLEAIQNKASKLAFSFKSRMVYVAKKEVKQVPKVANGFVGYMKQFMDIDLNNIRPDVTRTMTSVSYFFRDTRLIGRKNRIMRNYINRDDYAGAPAGIMNIEELATIWHFPVEAVVKAPMIQKAPGRKGMPPASLPFADLRVSGKLPEDQQGKTEIDPIFKEASEEETKNGLSTKHSEAKNKHHQNMVTKDVIKTDSSEIDPIFTEGYDDNDNSQNEKSKATKKGGVPTNLPFA